MSFIHNSLLVRSPFHYFSFSLQGQDYLEHKNRFDTVRRCETKEIKIFYIYYHKRWKQWTGRRREGLKGRPNDTDSFPYSILLWISCPIFTFRVYVVRCEGIREWVNVNQYFCFVCKFFLDSSFTTSQVDDVFGN